MNAPDQSSARRSPGPSYQQIIARDAHPPHPAVLRESSEPQGTSPVSSRRYVDRDEHRREVDRLWLRSWQMVCREEQLADVGDSHVYTVADRSWVVVRSAPDTIRAFENSCLHRGTALRVDDGNVGVLACPFHGWTWSLDGDLTNVPCEWDFDHLDRSELGLPQARVETWRGWVFVCPDPETMPFDEFLGGFPDLFPWAQEDRYLAAHVEKVLPCNWKVGMEAFLESYHVIATHPQLLSTLADSNTQYDIWPDEPRWNRMITAQGVNSPHIDDLTDQEVMDAVIAQFIGEGMSMPLPEGVSARLAMTNLFKAQLDGVGDDVEVAESEALDAIQYWVFPNFVPWGGWSKINYRFRPVGDDPDQCVMDVFLLEPFDQSGPRPAPAPTTRLAVDAPWADAPELGPLVDIFTQDSSNLGRIQRGLHTNRRGLHPGAYQESRIRHFHHELDRWLDEPTP